jgi:hypothetical protein
MEHDTGHGQPGHHGFGHDDDGNNTAGPGETHTSATVDQIDVTSYLNSAGAADGSFTEQLYLQVKEFELNGSPVKVPGFGTQFGMYFVIDPTGQTTAGVTSFSSMHIALMVDRGNDDGALSSTESGGVTFANSTRGDYALATGTLSSASLGVDPDGTRHPTFVQSLTLSKAGEQVFGGSLNTGDLLREVLTTPGGPEIFPFPDGSTIQVVNGSGSGTVTLSPQAPLSIQAARLTQDPPGHDFLAGCFH